MAQDASSSSAAAARDRDLDLAVDGIEGWTIWRFAAELEETLDISLDVIPLRPSTPVTRRIEERGRSCPSMRSLSIHEDLETLRGDVTCDIQQMEIVVEELEALNEDVGAGPATLRDRAAAGAFLTFFYASVERVLKCILRYHSLELPRSERAGVELFERFCAPHNKLSEEAVVEGPLPVLFEGEQVAYMDAYRSFHQMMQEGEGRDFRYEHLRVGVNYARQTFERFRSEVEAYLKRLTEQARTKQGNSQ